MANPRTIARIEAAIKRRIAYCLQFEVSDPRSGFVTITDVELSPDMSIAKVRWSVLDPERERVRSEAMLESARGFVQKQMGRVVNLRRLPRIQWVYDDSLAEAARLDRLIRDAQERDAEIRGAHEPGTGAAEAGSEGVDTQVVETDETTTPEGGEG
jgi:ribosome-binding factor A